jgi:sugar phosphate isomerase/epimerase
MLYAVLFILEQDGMCSNYSGKFKPYRKYFDKGAERMSSHDGKKASLWEFGIGVCVNHPQVDRGEDFSVTRYEEALAEIAAIGFRAIEYSHVAHLSEDECRDICGITEGLGMESWSIHSEHLNAESKESVKEYYRIQEICARNAAALKCKVMVLHPPHAQLSIDKKAEVIKQVAVIAENSGVRAVIENVGPTPSEPLRKMVELADHPNLGFILDTGHANIAADEPRGVMGALDLFADRLWSLHIQDNFGKNDDHCPPGLGTIDWPVFLKALAKTSYRGPLIVELTCLSVKSKRHSEDLRTLSLDVERVLARNYLEFALGKAGF